MTLALSEIQRSLGLFAESVAGTLVRIEALEEDRWGWPWDLALPDPLVVQLATVIDLDDTPDVERRVYRTQVLHQLALVEFGTFGPDAEAPDPDAAVRHPTIVASAHRAAAALVVVLLEQLRIDAAIRRSYPGAALDLDRLLAMVRGSGTASLEDRSDLGLVEALRQLCLGASGADLAHRCSAAHPADLEWLVDSVAPLRARDASLDRSAEIAVAIAALLRDRAAPTRPNDGEPFAPIVDDAVETDPDQEPLELEGMSTGPPPLDAEADRTAEDLEGSIQSSPLSFAEELEQLEKAATSTPRRPPPTTRRAIDPDARTFVYDEWNYQDRAYERSWCRVVERRLEGGDHEFMHDVRQRHAQLGGQIRRQFAKLRPQERVRMYRRDDGDELDLDAVIETIVDRRSGVAADDRLNIRRDRAARQVATAFLVDLSASTSSPAEEVDPPPPVDDSDDPFEDPFQPRSVVHDDTSIRRVIDVAKDAVALMSDALGQLGDRHAVYGFSGQGRHEVEFRVGKEFDDASAPSTWAAIAAMQPLSYTRMGPAIRHAATKLAGQDARTKLLIVISDGYPQDIDYGPDRRDKNYGLHDTARAIVEATQRGVDTFCVTIDPAGHDYLRVMSPDHRYLVIDDVESLPAELAKLYLDLAAAPSSTAGR